MKYNKKLIKLKQRAGLAAGGCGATGALELAGAALLALKVASKEEASWQIDIYIYTWVEHL